MTSQFATATNTDEISETKTVRTTHTVTNSITISDARRVATAHGVGDTDLISETVVKHPHVIKNLTDTDGISNIVRIKWIINKANTDEITNVVTVTGTYVQFDTWRPVAKPTDNNLILICRTPESLHDTPAGLEELSLWTITPDGGDEHPALLDPTVNGRGWLRMSHQEWSPDGNLVVIGVETSTEYKLVILDSSDFGT